jgi:hypothetical protein
MVHSKELDSPNEEGLHDFDNSPYFDYHHLKAIENVNKVIIKSICIYFLPCVA